MALWYEWLIGKTLKLFQYIVLGLYPRIGSGQKSLGKIEIAQLYIYITTFIPSQSAVVCQ